MMKPIVPLAGASRHHCWRFGAGAGIARGAASPVEVWRNWASDVRGEPIDAGHFLPEENLQATIAALLPFLRDG